MFRTDNPSFSGLKLTESWLLLREVASLGLSSWLAVLSECATGQVAVHPGDEHVTPRDPRGESAVEVREEPARRLRRGERREAGRQDVGGGEIVGEGPRPTGEHR